MMNKYLIIAVAVLTAGLLSTFHIMGKQRDKIVMQKQNISTLQDGMTKYQTKDGLYATKIGNLQQTVSDLKKYNTDMVEEVKNLGLSLRKLEKAIKISSVTTFDNYTNVRDTTIIKNDTSYIHISTYNDDWIDFYHSVRDKQTDSLKIVCKNDMYQFISWEREGFWLTRFLKKKKYYLVTKTKNPYIEVDSIRFIDVVK